MGLFSRRPPPPADTTHPYPWFSAADESTVQRGAPEPYEWWQRKPVGPRMHPQGVPVFLYSRPYSRGSDAYSPKFGRLAFNPIGAGVVNTARLPTIAGPSGRYEFGVIFFDVQRIPTSLPANLTVPQEVIDTLVANGSVGGSIATTG